MGGEGNATPPNSVGEVNWKTYSKHNPYTGCYVGSAHHAARVAANSISGFDSKMMGPAYCAAKFSMNMSYSLSTHGLTGTATINDVRYSYSEKFDRIIEGYVNAPVKSP